MTIYNKNTIVNGVDNDQQNNGKEVEVLDLEQTEKLGVNWADESQSIRSFDLGELCSDVGLARFASVQFICGECDLGIQLKGNFKLHIVKKGTPFWCDGIESFVKLRDNAMILCPVLEDGIGTWYKEDELNFHFLNSEDNFLVEAMDSGVSPYYFDDIETMKKEYTERTGNAIDSFPHYDSFKWRNVANMYERDFRVMYNQIVYNYYFSGKNELPPKNDDESYLITFNPESLKMVFVDIE